ncbi:nucleolus and neural progenitor protein-like [Montipora capricornis]|uniref:nucleolus and neural progenitor protein-like n=1 Tax=Montipora capricornis TaxID=246305 RepID=UPI0035F18119
MAASSCFWNRREVLRENQAFSETGICKDSVEREEIVDTIKRLDLLHCKLHGQQLWAEGAIVDALIYKNSNQHRKEKYFQGLKKVVKCLNRLQEMRIFNKVVDVKNKFPRLSRSGFLVGETISNYPSTELIISILSYLTGAAKLLLQVMTYCKETFQYCCCQMECGFFLTFHVACSSSLSRIWVLTRVLLKNIVLCYEVLFPWLNYLSGSPQISVHNSLAKDLPVSLKAWFDDLTLENNNQSSGSLTPSSRTARNGTLDKLFGSATQKPEDSEKPASQKQNEENESGVSSTNESFAPKRKLFLVNLLNTQELQKADANSSIKKSKKRRGKKRSLKYMINENFHMKSTKKQKTGTTVEASFKNSQKRVSRFKTIHIYSNKRWKLCVERAKRMKLKGSILKKLKSRWRGRTCVTHFCKAKSGKMYRCRSISNKSQTLTVNFGNLKQRHRLKAAVRGENAAIIGTGLVQNKTLSSLGTFRQSKKGDPINEIDIIFNMLEQQSGHCL